MTNKQKIRILGKEKEKCKNITDLFFDFLILCGLKREYFITESNTITLTDKFSGLSFSW